MIWKGHVTDGEMGNGSRIFVENLKESNLLRDNDQKDNIVISLIGIDYQNLV
jgi:hypothetical protein